MTYSQETSDKVVKFVKESNDAHRGFDQAMWNVVKDTIPAHEQVEAEAEVKEGIK